MRDETTDKAGEAWRPRDCTQITSFEFCTSSKVENGPGDVNFNVFYYYYMVIYSDCNVPYK